MLGMFDYPETQVHPAYNLSLRVNFVDGTGGTNYLRMVGSEGSMTVEWGKVTLYRNNVMEDANDPLMQNKKQPGYRQAICLRSQANAFSRKNGIHSRQRL